MKSVLVIFLLTIQGSYLANTEEAATASRYDTIQFYSGESGNWRIKTYAIDEDVHIWSLGGNVGDIVALAKANTEKNYGDVLSKAYVIESDDGIEGIKRGLIKKGLPSNLELPPSGAVFWAPVGTRYRSKSAPK